MGTGRSVFDKIRNLIGFPIERKNYPRSIIYQISEINAKIHNMHAMQREFFASNRSSGSLTSIAALRDEMVRQLLEARRAFADSEHNVGSLHDEMVRQLIRTRQDAADMRADIKELREEMDLHLIESRRYYRAVLPDVLHTHLWSPDTAEKIRAALRLLRPMQVSGFRKTRVGRDFDGGYIQLDDFGEVKSAISLGVGDDDSWDVAISNRGIKVFRFDHTISAPPTISPDMMFFQKRVARESGQGQVSINSVMQEYPEAGTLFIMKMDIESDEWDVLDAVNESLFGLCKQFVCEFHCLDRLCEDDFRQKAARVWQKISSIFFVCHVHANNCGNIYNIGNITVPETIEITFANRKFYDAADTVESFPTAIDMPNQNGRADIFLGSFRF